jgi:hypothetical protein
MGCFVWRQNWSLNIVSSYAWEKIVYNSNVKE